MNFAQQTIVDGSTRSLNCVTHERIRGRTEIQTLFFCQMHQFTCFCRIVRDGFLGINVLSCFQGAANHTVMRPNRGKVDDHLNSRVSQKFIDRVGFDSKLSRSLFSSLSVQVCNTQNRKILVYSRHVLQVNFTDCTCTNYANVHTK